MRSCLEWFGWCCYGVIVWLGFWLCFPIQAEMPRLQRGPGWFSPGDHVRIVWCCDDHDTLGTVEKVVTAEQETLLKVRPDNYDGKRYKMLSLQWLTEENDWDETIQEVRLEPKK